MMDWFKMVCNFVCYGEVFGFYRDFEKFLKKCMFFF